ncbi:MAG: protein translocase subunit SecD [Candidatus Liptonbacteria bacterium CG11_big_fil_rev_8_21_14_0_20_35_14]|uniref:Protein translocase subunit SecD n=1 Tax=Candidatus Liptonbacteria bacterium CG11_big_fil_rev_8_21_14_0_20_35_14 TaxID=1974634 RepID=A0A2H0N893_9BACT|nr:MAG: protein translocase subunit SecD [Candidatus Liptonbacteria bacterium CG11_big_fil_rev_8_21_14_0_20_35_14]
MNKGKNIFILLLIGVVVIFSLFFIYPIKPLEKLANDFRPWRLGLDLVGGSFLIYEIDMSEVETLDQSPLASGLRDVIEKRVNSFGVSEPQVVIANSDSGYRLLVSLAGVHEVSEAIRQIGLTPLLDFREVVLPSNLEEGQQILPGDIQFVKTNLTGRYIESAQVAFDQTGVAPIVSLNFNKEGGDIFEEITARNVGKNLAVFLDDNLVQIATVQQKISGGKAQISGQFSLDEANILVQRFNAGALPAPINLINQQTVSATLGVDSLNRAVVAGVVGIMAIMLFMIFYYGILGVFASIALIIYVLIAMMVFKFIPVTMTLSGIAGFLLSIGMAIDANILIFERTKEELKRGASYNQAIEEGFLRAWTSIRDSNISTIITAIILYYFTSSFVQGFALTLLIGVLVSMLSAIFVTRVMLRVFYRKKHV